MLRSFFQHHRAPRYSKRELLGESDRRLLFKAFGQWRSFISNSDTSPDQQAKPVDRATVGATPPPQFVTTTQSVSFAVPYGTIELPPGTRLEFVSKEGFDVHIRYNGAEYFIPISATDLK